MDRTIRDLRSRIATLVSQRDAIAGVLCEKNDEVDLWKYRCKEFAKIARMMEQERDQAIRRAEIAEEDNDGEFERDIDEALNEIDDDDDDLGDFDVCYKCGACVRSLCCCHDRNFDVTI